MSRLDTRAAAEYLGLHRKTVIGLIHAGELPAENVGGSGNGARYRFDPRHLQRWQQSRRVAP